MAYKPLVAITGASSGIGEATARAFSAAGYPVLLMARRLARLEELQLPNCVCRKVDVRDRAALNAAVGDAEEIHGPIDMMVANAGIARLADIGRQPPEEWDEMIDINTKGVMNAVHAVMAGMMQRRCGTLVMTSSIAGRRVYPDQTVYCATKFFVHAVSESLREYLSDYDVRVIVVSPGMIKSDLLSGVRDPLTQQACQDELARIGGAIGADILADMILDAYQLPQNASVQEIRLTPTRQKY